MRKIAGQLLAVLALVVCLVLPASLAQAADGADIELVIDYLNRHQVTLIIPAGFSPDALREHVGSIIASPLILQNDWDAEDGMHIWLYDAPELVTGAGLQKAELWDCSQLAATAAASGLSGGVNLFLVVNQPAGAMSYDVYVSDQGTDLSPVAADEMEIWWGFGLQPDGPAPILSLLIWLRPLVNLITLAPLWIPFIICCSLIAFQRRLGLGAFHHLQLIVSWVVISLSVLLAFLLQWQGVLAFLLGGSTGVPGLVSLLLTAFIPFAWSALLLRLPWHRRLVQERQQRWTLRLYLADSWRLIVGSLAIGLMTLAWFAVVESWAHIGLWLAILGGLLLMMILVGILIEGGMVLRFGRRPAMDFGAEAMIRSLSARLRIDPPALHFIPVDKLPQANAFAAGLLFPRVYVTRLLWDSLNQGEQQFILAHELAHVQRRDTLRLFALFLLPVWLLASSLILLLFVDDNWALGAAGGLLLAAVAVTLGVTMPIRRSLESKADVLALRATGDPLAAEAALRHMHAEGQPDRRRRRPATHPNLASRLERLRKAKGGD